MRFLVLDNMIITAIRIAKLLVKKYRNELTDQDRMELERWYSAHPTNKPFEDTLMSNDVDEKEHAWLDCIDTEAAWKKANGEQKQVAEKLSLSESSNLFTTESESQNLSARSVVTMLNTLVVPMANHFQLTLSDGTSIWVNANSELKFPTKFSESERKVYLKGEAYFEVAKDAKKPFYVVTENGTVKVLGTHFNVSAYGNTSKTTLAEGLVEVSKSGNREIIKPGQKAEIKGDEIQVKKANLQKDLAWKNNEFYFNKDNIVDIATQLKMWYDLDVSLGSDVSLTETYSGEIKRDSKLSEVIKMLEFVSDLKFALDKNKLLITKK